MTIKIDRAAPAAGAAPSATPSAPTAQSRPAAPTAPAAKPAAPSAAAPIRPAASTASTAAPATPTAATPTAAPATPTAATPTREAKVRRLAHDAFLPVYASECAACFDLFAYVDNEHQALTVPANGDATISTMLQFEVPQDHAMLIYSRSGMGFNHGIRLANCTGVIDSDYRGEVKVKLRNDTPRNYTVRHGDRVAQAMIVAAPHFILQEVVSLSQTTRGSGGMGSTGA